MPDYYSLTLEVARNRTTKTWSEVCTPTAHRSGLCPSDVAINDVFFRRTLNEPCSFKVSDVINYEVIDRGFNNSRHRRQRIDGEEVLDAALVVI